MGTQWRVSHAGAYGLDYGVLPEIWRRTKTPPAKRDQVFASLQIMEREALKEMRKE